MSMPTLTGAWTGRRRAWLLACCAFLAVLAYLVGWIAYATNGLTALGRLDQRPPGASGYAYGAEYRLLSLTRTLQIRDQDDDQGRSETATAGASWVVAEIEVTRREDVPDYFCTFELVGPDRRRWDPDPPLVTRTTTSFCKAEELPLGRPGTVEVVFEIPDAFLDRIYGVAVPDTRTREATPVIRPA